MRCHHLHHRQTLDRAESSGEGRRDHKRDQRARTQPHRGSTNEHQRERHTFEEWKIWVALKKAKRYQCAAQRRVSKFAALRCSPSGRNYPRQVYENHDNDLALGSAQEKP